MSKLVWVARTGELELKRSSIPPCPYVPAYVHLTAGTEKFSGHPVDHVDATVAPVEITSPCWDDFLANRVVVTNGERP